MDSGIKSARMPIWVRASLFGHSFRATRASRRNAENALKRMPRQAGEGFQVFLLGALDDEGWKLGCRRLLVPIDALQIVAQKLFVEARLAAAGLVLVGGPETRGIGGEQFVDEDQPTVKHAE